MFSFNKNSISFKRHMLPGWGSRKQD